MRQAMEIHQTAKERRKRTRGLLPLQRDHRTKFGCEWFRSIIVVSSRTGAKALGCVVCERAVRREERSLWDKLSSRGEEGRM